jgi:hypothetical protein
LQELCKIAKIKKLPIGEFMQKGSNPPQPTTPMWKCETKTNACTQQAKTKQERIIL